MGFSVESDSSNAMSVFILRKVTNSDSRLLRTGSFRASTGGSSAAFYLQVSSKPSFTNLMQYDHFNAFSAAKIGILVLEFDLKNLELEFPCWCLNFHGLADFIAN